MVTKGHRRLGKTIKILENSVEFSSKESRAKESEKKYRETTQRLAGYTEDSPIQSLRNLSIRKQDSAES
jgi:hypothetical protein